LADPRRFNLPDRIILPEAATDRLGLAVLALARELWVVKDRQLVLEAVLAAHGIDAATAIDRFEPDAAQAAKLDTEGRAMIDHIVAALTGGET